MSYDAKPPDPPAGEADDQAASEVDEDEMNGSLPEGVFIMPDEPIRHEARGVPEDAFISPDEPMVRSDPQGVVTGIAGMSKKKKVSATKLAAGGRDWNIRHAADILDHLSNDLRERGIEALRTHPEMEPMDGMLRGLVAGFLLGRQEIE